MKNNISLVKHAEMALNQKWGYVYGTFGQTLSETLLKQKMNQYPSNVKQFESFIRQNWMNKPVVDCIGLVKSYLWLSGGTVKYNASQDKSANMMYGMAKEKGPLSSIPEIPGILVHKNNHVGIYIGNGQVIESRGTKAGVIKSPLRGSGSARWTHWYKCTYIDYKSVVKPINKVKVNILGRKMELNGELKNGTNYVEIKIGNKVESLPIRDIAEGLGLIVSWDAKTQTVILK